jgi:hypothetical protein
MKNSKLLIMFFALAVVFTTSSCKKEGCTDETATNYNEDAKKDDGSCLYPTPLEGVGDVEIKLSHVWAMSEAPFVMNSVLVHPMNGDSLTFTTFKYYISNFKLKNSDGNWWSHPESYFLVDLSNSASTTLTLTDVPEGSYTEMSYVLGVDSTRNVSGAQSGALSTANGMFWSWSTGYIMLKAEGTSPDSGTGSFSFHLGGFSGSNNIVTSKTASFGSETLNVTEDKNVQVNLKLNPARLFHTIGSVSGTNTIHMPGTDAKTMATDFYGNASFTSIVN